MPVDRSLWQDEASIPDLDSLGTDIYLVNRDRDVEDMTPMVRELECLCRKEKKLHHEWLQCLNVHSGKEGRIMKQGKILVRGKPDALYVWAYKE